MMGSVQKGYSRATQQEIDAVITAQDSLDQSKAKGKLGPFHFRVLSMRQEGKELKAEYKVVSLGQMILKKLGLGDKSIQDKYIKKQLTELSEKVQSRNLDKKLLSSETAGKLNALFAQYQVKKVLSKETGKKFQEISKLYKEIDELQKEANDILKVEVSYEEQRTAKLIEHSKVMNKITIKKSKIDALEGKLAKELGLSKKAIHDSKPGKPEKVKKRKRVAGPSDELSKEGEELKNKIKTLKNSIRSLKNTIAIGGGMLIPGLGKAQEKAETELRKAKARLKELTGQTDTDKDALVNTIRGRINADLGSEDDF